jgi:hypothetical protein
MPDSEGSRSHESTTCPFCRIIHGEGQGHGGFCRQPLPVGSDHHLQEYTGAACSQQTSSEARETA